MSKAPLSDLASLVLWQDVSNVQRRFWQLATRASTKRSRDRGKRRLYKNCHECGPANQSHDQSDDRAGLAQFVENSKILKNGPKEQHKDYRCKQER